jgi:hypothetical protein
MLQSRRVREFSGAESSRRAVAAVVRADKGVVGARGQDVEVFETGCCKWHRGCDGQEARDAEELSEMHFFGFKSLLENTEMIEG